MESVEGKILKAANKKRKHEAEVAIRRKKFDNHFPSSSKRLYVCIWQMYKCYDDNCDNFLEQNEQEAKDAIKLWLESELDDRQLYEELDSIYKLMKMGIKIYDMEANDEDKSMNLDVNNFNYDFIF